MKKKLSALFMVFAMVLSLFSGLGVNTIWADVNEEEGGDTKEVISGLAAMDWLEWDDNGNITGPNEQATWMKGLGSVVNGTTLLVKELDETGNPTGGAIQADALTLAYCGNGEEPNESPQTENVGSIAPVENNADYVQLKFSDIGWYKLYLTDRTDSDEITIQVGYKDLGFYTTDTKTPEGAIDSYDYTSEKDGVIYLITSAPEDVTWDGNETWQVNVDGNENIDENLYSKYFTKTLVSPDNSSQEKVYKLTLKKGTFERLDICVKANGTFGNEDTWNPEEWLNVHYEGKMSGLRVSNNMEDISDEGGRECFSQVIYPLHRFMAWQEDGTEKIYQASELAVESVDGRETATLKDSKEQENAVEISVSDAGDYKVYVKDDPTDYVTIHMSYPESAYYTTENPSVNGLLDGSVNYTYNSTKSGNVLYFIANIPEDVSEVEYEWNVSTNAGDVAADDINRYVSIEEIARGKFKLTLKDTTEYLYLIGKVHQPGFDPDHGQTEGWGTVSWLTTQFTGSSAGFSVTQNFHWDDKAGHMAIDDEAHYTKEGWGNLNHQQTYQFAKVAADGSVEKVYTKDELAIEPMADATGTAFLVQPDDYIRIKFNGTGEYKIYAKENPDDAVIVSADFNKVGLYTAEEVSADTVCDSESTIWKDECNVLYVIPYGVDENLTPKYKFFVEPADEDRSYGIADFYTVEDLKNGNYKITINKEQKKNFTVGVTMELYNGDDQVDETEAGVWVQSKEEYPQEQGFVAIADLDRENPVIPTDIKWYSNIGAYYTDEVCIVFATIDNDEQINIVPADQLSLTDSEGNPVGSITANAKDNRFCDLTFPGIGSYKVVNNKTKEVVNLDVYYREVAFYKNTTVSKESYLSSMKTDSDNPVFYMVENREDDYSIKNIELRAGIYEDGKEEPTYFTDSAKYFTYEVVNASEPCVYKITLGAKSGFPEEFFIEAKAQIQDAYGTYDTDGYVWIYTDKDSSDSGNTGGGSSGGSTGGGSTVTPAPAPTPTPAPETKPEQTTTETKTDTIKNDSGNTVKQEVTTVKNSDGTVASTTTKSEIENAAKNTSASVTVTKDAEGKIATAEAAVENTVKAGKNDTVKTTISATVVKQMTEAAGTTDLTITQTVKDTKGKVLYTVETNAEDLKAGKKLTLVKMENGKKILVTKPVTVDKKGNVNVKAEEGEYQLLNEQDAKKLQKEILKTVEPKKDKMSVSKGKKESIKLSNKLDMDNVAKITYTSSDKSKIKVDKNGKITAKKKGTVTVKVKVTLNDGTTKTVKVKVKVK